MMEHGQLAEALPLLTNYVAAEAKLAGCLEHAAPAPHPAEQYQRISRRDRKDLRTASCGSIKSKPRFRTMPSSSTPAARKCRPQPGSISARARKKCRNSIAPWPSIETLAQVLSRRPASADRPAQRRAALPEAPESSQDALALYQAAAESADSPSRLGPAHTVRNQGSKGGHVHRECSRSRGTVEPLQERRRVPKGVSLRPMSGREGLCRQR